MLAARAKIAANGGILPRMEDTKHPVRLAAHSTTQPKLEKKKLARKKRTKTAAPALSSPPPHTHTQASSRLYRTSQWMGAASSDASIPPNLRCSLSPNLMCEAAPALSSRKRMPSSTSEAWKSSVETAATRAMSARGCRSERGRAREAQGVPLPVPSAAASSPPAAQEQGTRKVGVASVQCAAAAAARGGGEAARAALWGRASAICEKKNFSAALAQHLSGHGTGVAPLALTEEHNSRGRGAPWRDAAGKFFPLSVGFAKQEWISSRERGRLQETVVEALRRSSRRFSLNLTAGLHPRLDLLRQQLVLLVAVV